MENNQSWDSIAMAIVGADESGGDKGGSLGTTHFYSNENS